MQSFKINLNCKKTVKLVLTTTSKYRPPVYNYYKYKSSPSSTSTKSTSEQRTLSTMTSGHLNQAQNEQKTCLQWPLLLILWKNLGWNWNGSIYLIYSERARIEAPSDWFQVYAHDMTWQPHCIRWRCTLTPPKGWDVSEHTQVESFWSINMNR